MFKVICIFGRIYILRLYATRTFQTSFFRHKTMGSGSQNLNSDSNQIQA